MLCEMCNKNEATAYIQQTINGNTKSMRVCANCLHQMQMEYFGNLNMFSGHVNISGKKLRCGRCGKKLDDIKRTLYVGCPNCYVELEEQLEPIIKNLQNAYHHTGTLPSNKDAKPIQKLPPQPQPQRPAPFPPNISAQQAAVKSASSVQREAEEGEMRHKINAEIDDLKTKLKKAIETERYEEAEVLSGKIKRLKEKLSI